MAQDVVYPKNVPCGLEKKVYSSAFGCKVLKIQIRSILSNELYEVCVSLMILCFDDLSIGVIWMLKSPPITVILSISLLMPVIVCLMY